MSHQFHLSDTAFQAYERRAKRVGLTVAEYLDKSAPAESDGFTLTPEMRACIELGLAQADSGRLVGFEQVHESLAQYKAAWREKKSR
jgi:hypothetical protein